MKTEIKTLPKSKIQINVFVPFEKFKDFIDLAYKNLSKNLKIDGFREGKIPKEILEKNINQNDLYNEVAKIVVEKTFPEIIKNNKLKIIDYPKIQITKLVPNSEIEYTAEASIMPKIENLDYKNIKVKKQKIQVEDKEVEKAILWLRKSRAKYFKVERPAKFNDFISIDFESYINGVKLEGGSDKNHYFILGEGKFLPGFEKELEGMKIGEEKQFSIKVDNNYYHKAVSGKIVDFKVRMNDIQQVELPELTNEFIKTLGNFENSEQLFNSIKEGIFQEKELKEKERIRQEILNNLIKRNSNFEIPEVLINNEVEHIKSEMKANLEQYGIDFNNYLANIKETEDSLNKKLLKEAEQRVRGALIIREIANKENISANEEEIELEISKILRDPTVSSKLKLKNIDDENLRNYTENIIRNEKTLKFLEKEATK